MIRASSIRPLDAVLDAYSEASPYLVRYLAAWAPLAAAYMIVFIATRNESLGWAVLQALANIALPLILGVPVFGLVAALVLRAHLLVQAAAHIILSIAYTALWYALLMHLFAFIGWLRSGEWRDVSFTGAALTWQLFQGLTVYALIVAATYVIVMMVRGGPVAAGLPGRHAGPAPDETRPRPAAPSRLFVKQDGELRPLDPEDIISISGADDYSAIHTRSGSRLVRATLASLEARLDPSCFMRVHRSYIINVRQLANLQTRPDGAMSACMMNGETIPVSRHRAHRLRAMMV
jgi:two-component system, LytTR family, response regulator